MMAEDESGEERENRDNISFSSLMSPDLLRELPKPPIDLLPPDIYHSSKLQSSTRIAP
jgi:hypothetical protein